MEPLFALVWLPSAFVGRAAAAVPVGNKKCQADEQKKILVEQKPPWRPQQQELGNLQPLYYGNFSTAVTLETRDRLPL